MLVATVTASPLDELFIEPVTASSSHYLTIEGMACIITSFGKCCSYIIFDYLKIFFSDLPNPEVTIFGPTNGTAGEQMVLTCTVRVVELVSVPSVEWNGGSVGRENGVIESNTTYNRATNKNTMTFSPLHTSHGALYTCTATIIDQSINLTKTGSKDARIYVQS